MEKRERKKGSGGPRRKAGRPKVKNPKQPMFIYPTKEEVEILGGVLAAKQLAETTISEKAIHIKRMAQPLANVFKNGK